MDNQRNKSRRGTMIVEAAIIMPVLVLLTFAGLKYGWLFIKWQQITNVARYSVRLAVRPDFDSTATLALINTQMNAAGMTVYDPNVVVDVPVRSPVVVSISVPVDSIDILKLGKPGGIVFLPTPQYLTATMTMSKEGSN